MNKEAPTADGVHLAQQGSLPEPVTIASITAQIEDIHRKTNRLIEGICEQRDEARAVLQAIAYCLELTDDTPHGVQIKAGRGEDFWRTMYELKKVHP
jgi:hypothetical protein